jgi:hypothetical protein
MSKHIGGSRRNIARKILKQAALEALELRVMLDGGGGVTVLPPPNPVNHEPDGHFYWNHDRTLHFDLSGTVEVFKHSLTNLLTRGSTSSDGVSQTLPSDSIDLAVGDL